MRRTRISLDLNDVSFARLNQLVELTGEQNKVAVIRDALKMYEYVVKSTLNGSKIICVTQTGEKTEILSYV